jgi:hypothetical protein
MTSRQSAWIALGSQDRSSITRLPASVILMRPTKRLSVLTVPRGAIASPGADEAGQRAVGERDRHAGTERTAGEQLERPTLFRVDATLSRGDIVIHSHSYDMRWKSPTV